jgi:hypothetical protein
MSFHENSFIIKELAYALEEILASRNALTVFCCDLDQDNFDEFERVIGFYKNDNMAGLMNYINSGESNVKGMGAFVSGLIVAKKWGLKLEFKPADKEISGKSNLLTGYAEMQRRVIFK